MLLLCKGAESTILEKSITGDKEATLQHVNDYAMVRSSDFDLVVVIDRNANEVYCGLVATSDAGLYDRSTNWSFQSNLCALPITALLFLTILINFSGRDINHHKILV